MTGQKFGKLTVLSRSLTPSTTTSRSARWIVQCDCDLKGERLKILPAIVLRGGYTGSCGCAVEMGEIVRSADKRQKANEHRRRRYATDAKFVLTVRVKALLRQTLKNKKAYRTQRLLKNLDYSIEQLEAHLRTTIPLGHTWDDFLQGKLHIDHKKPIASFRYNFDTDHGFKDAWALSNLQLLTPKDNRAKRAKLNWTA